MISIKARCLLFLIAACLGVSGYARKDKPNFVFIFADDQGYNDLGCFGSPDIKTPRIDQLARDGMKFTNFYAQTICGPSRTALMTGCYPMRVGELDNFKNIHPIPHPKEILLPQLLKASGYTNGCIGKWDLARHNPELTYPELSPTYRGFDYWFGVASSNDGGHPPYFRNGKRIGEDADMNSVTHRYTEEALEFIRKHQDTPFFLYLAHTMPHTILGASEAFRGKSKRGLYGDVIEELDWSTGQVLDLLKELGLQEDTYVVYTSDNGPWWLRQEHGGSAYPLRSGKVSTWDGGPRVPCIMYAPRRIPAGSICERVTTTMDILPTFVALAGGKLPSDRVIDGRDISSLLHGEGGSDVAEKPYYYYLWTHLQAVRYGDWKLVLPRPSRPKWLGHLVTTDHINPEDMPQIESPRLYNLRYDIGEQDDWSNMYPDVVGRLMKLAEDARQDLGDYNEIGTGQRQYYEDKPLQPITRNLTDYGKP